VEDFLRKSLLENFDFILSPLLGQVLPEISLLLLFESYYMRIVSSDRIPQSREWYSRGASLIGALISAANTLYKKSGGTSTPKMRFFRKISTFQSLCGGPGGGSAGRVSP
jgi:hypothetical protein